MATVVFAMAFLSFATAEALHEAFLLFATTHSDMCSLSRRCGDLRSTQWRRGDAAGRRAGGRYCLWCRRRSRRLWGGNRSRRSERFGLFDQLGERIGE